MTPPTPAADAARLARRFTAEAEARADAERIRTQPDPYASFAYLDRSNPR